MLFNSLSFAVFLPLVFGLYWLIASPKDDGFVSPTRLNLQDLFVSAHVEAPFPVPDADVRARQGDPAEPQPGLLDVRNAGGRFD